MHFSESGLTSEQVRMRLEVNEFLGKQSDGSSIHTGTLQIACKQHIQSGEEAYMLI